LLKVVFCGLLGVYCSKLTRNALFAIRVLEKLLADVSLGGNNVNVENKAI
jgi:hypothetical protein